MAETKERTFPAGPGFSALVHAEAWCRENRFAHGPTHNATRAGVHRQGRATTYVPRWGRMSPSQQSALDGFFEAQNFGSFHDDGVVLTLRADLIPETEHPEEWS